MPLIADHTDSAIYKFVSCPSAPVFADKNHTGLSPLRITVIHDFVFTSDQVSPGGSTVIGLINGTYFSCGFGTLPT